MDTITISIARFQQLIRAEQDANQLKTLIATKLDNYANIERDELKMLHAIYCGDGE